MHTQAPFPRPALPTTPTTAATTRLRLVGRSGGGSVATRSPAQRGLIPARVVLADALYLPRLILIGVLTATAGTVLGFQHTPGLVSLTDVVAVVLFAVGCALVGLGVRPTTR